MNLKDYVKRLQDILNYHEGNGELIMVYSSDDEGNNIDTVNYKPSVGHYDGEDFIMYSDIEDGEEVNAVCVN